MKKCLQLSVLPLLLSAVLFCSCKDDNPGNPNPIVDASVQDAKVTIDQANKRIDVLFYEYNPLSAVEITFKFVDGAYLYTPLMKNPATLDLRMRSTVRRSSYRRATIWCITTYTAQSITRSWGWLPPPMTERSKDVSYSTRVRVKLRSNSTM